MPKQMNLKEFAEKCEKELFNGAVYAWGDIPKIANANGVYMIMHDNNIVYIGESKDILNRFKKNHARGANSAFRKNLSELEIPDNYLEECEIRYLILQYGRKEVEEELIKKYKPMCNKL